MPQVPTVCHSHKVLPREAHLGGMCLAIRQMGPRPDQITTNGLVTTLILPRSDRLPHKVGRSGAVSPTNRGKMHKVFVEEYYLQISGSLIPWSQIMENSSIIQSSSHFVSSLDYRTKNIIELWIVANKTIKENLKKNLEKHKGSWIDELPRVL